MGVRCPPHTAQRNKYGVEVKCEFSCSLAQPCVCRKFAAHLVVCETKTQLARGRATMTDMDVDAELHQVLARAPPAPAQAEPEQAPKAADPQQTRAQLLKHTAEHGRCGPPAALVATDDHLGLLPIPPPPAEQPRTKAEVLQERLTQVQRLKRQYSEHYQAALDHVHIAAASLQRCQHSLLRDGPDSKRTKLDGASAASPATAAAPDPAAGTSAGTGIDATARQKPAQTQHEQQQNKLQPKEAARRKMSTSGLVALGRAVDGSIAPSETAKAPSQTPVTSHEPLATFSETEAEAIDAVSSSAAGTSSAAAPASKMSLSSWHARLGRDAGALGDHERVAAAVAAGDMDARDACAVLCGRKHRFYVHQTVVLVGRESKSKGEVCSRLLVSSGP